MILRFRFYLIYIFCLNFCLLLSTGHKFELKDEKYYQCMERMLTEVNQHNVKMDEQETKQCVQTAQNVVNVVIQKLKNIEAFKQMYLKTEYVGSYFDGLRVKSATEFDLNLIMKLPLNYGKIKVENSNVACGFVKVNIKDAKDNPKYDGDLKKIVDKWCDSEDYLQQNKFREWMEGTMSKTLGMTKTTVNIDGRDIQVRLRKSGPAFTLLIEDGDKKIDVDLVFTLEFVNKQPPSPIRWNPNSSSSWILVPKEINNHQSKNLFWRISFPDAEKKLMQNNYKLKYTNRLLKALRDAQNFNIPSYFLKTVFLWEAHDIPRGEKKFWQKNLGYLYVYALSKFLDYLENKKLPHYWHKKMNLLDGYNDANIKNISGRLKNILKKVDDHLLRKNHDELKKYLFSLYGIDSTNSIVAVEHFISSFSSPNDYSYGSDKDVYKTESKVINKVADKSSCSIS